MKSVFLLLFSLFISINAIKFNAPRILLPAFDNIRINYTLKVVEKGCFLFRISSGPELIKIRPLYDEDNSECSHQVLITAISKQREKNTAILLAESLETGEVLRCDVILDRIHRFGVHTTTRELYLEEAPETFELSAQDAQGNDFTTLEGVEFNWQIGTQSRIASGNQKDGKTRHQVLKFLTFSESKYHQVPKAVEKFDQVGLKGSMVLLEGINSGSAKVIVKLPYTEYKDVSEVEVDITVLANLILDPDNVHILVDDTINFRVLQLKQGKLHEISLGPQYYLEIENSNYATIDGSLATGLALGKTSVILRDHNVDRNSVNIPMPKAILTVSQPEKIALNLLPHYNWVTIEGCKHEISIDLFTKEDQKITLGSKYKLDSSFDNLMFREIKRNQNGSRIIGKTVGAGTNPVTGSFENLMANADMLVYGQLDIFPKLVIVPLDVNKLSKYKIQFTATGGDNSFTWSTGNQNLLQIQQNGLAESQLDRSRDTQLNFETTKSGITASTTVKAAISRNLKIFKTAQVLFLPPVKLEIVGYNFETALDDNVNIYVSVSAFYNNTFMPFTSCDNLHFDLEFTNQIFNVIATETEDENDRFKDACRLVRLKGINIGTTTLKVSYKFGELTLQDDVLLVVYEKLSIYNPESNVVILPIGSSRNVFYQHGPKKVFNEEAELMRDLNYAKTIVSVDEIKSEFQDQRFAYKILCRKVGETKLNLQIYNVLSRGNFIKYVSEVETLIYCVKPRFVNLYTLEKLKTSCPIDSKNALMHVRSTENTLDIEIEILDAQKRKLDNITSLLIDFQFSQANGDINHNIVFNQMLELDEIDSVPIPKRNYLKTLKTANTEANVNHKIKAMIKNYNLEVLNKLSITPEIPNFGIQKVTGGEFVKPSIENELNFLSFDSALLPIQSVSVYLAPGVIQRIRLGQGSGFYEIKVKDSLLLDVEHDKMSSELILKPKSIGETTVMLIDRCLKTEPTVLHVSIVSVGRVDLSSPDRVEKSKIIEAIVKLYDSNDQLLMIEAANFDIYHLNENVYNERVLKMKLGNQMNLQRGEIRYVLTGVELGETKISVSSGSVSSLPVNVQVFPALVLLPKNATILVGSLLEVSSRGGPKPDGNIIYQVANSAILAIDGSVVEGKKVGVTKVTGRSVGINPADGSQIVFSEDSIYVNVIPLNKIKIKAPLQRLKSDAIMPATIWADPDISPMILGTLKNLKIRWHTDAPDLIEIKGVFEDLGVVYGDKDSISVRIRGIKQGKGRIFATATLGSQKLVAEQEVIIFKTLELESPKRIIRDPIIIPPKTSLQLKANLDDTVYELNNQADSTIINVSRDGVARSFETVGRSLIIASSMDQNLDIPIEVKNVHYILASVAVGSAKLKKITNELPQNLNLVLKVTLHDNLGNVFSHDFDDLNYLKHKLSNRDAVDVHIGDNFTLSLNLQRETANILAITLKDSAGIKYPEDFVKLAVKSPEGLFSKQLIATVGDVICFESPLSEGFRWHSNSDSIVMQSNTGIGRIMSKSSSNVVVYHGDVRGTYIDYELDIRDADKVEFNNSVDIFNGETYRGYFTISNHMQVQKTSNLVTSNRSNCDDLQENFTIDFVTCKLVNREDISILKKFSVSPVFDKALGSYACEVKVLTSIEDITSISRNKNVKLQLQVTIPNGITDTLDLKVSPAVQILPKSISVDNLGQQEITVTGMENILQKVEVTSSNPEHLTLVQMPKTTNTLHYKTKLMNSGAADVDLHVRVNSPLTHQIVQIPILAMSRDQLSPKSENLVLGFVSDFGKIIALTVVVVTSIFLIIKCYPRDRFDNSTVFVNPRNTSANNSGNTSMFNPSTPNLFSASPLSSQQQQSSPNRTFLNYNPLGNQPQTPVYGDPTIVSPHRRINRRNL